MTGVTKEIASRREAAVLTNTPRPGDTPEQVAARTAPRGAPTHDASRTSLTLANGAMLDLLNPNAADIDFEVIAEHLAKANRYCGATPNVVYSVAEHSCRCALAALNATGDRRLAAYLLCHDMHEAYLGDDITPKKRALAEIMGEFGILSPVIKLAFDTLTNRLDKVIHARAGLPWPPSPEMQERIHHWDRVLLATEWRDLMCCPPPYDFGKEPLPEPINPLQWWETSYGWMMNLCEEYGIGATVDAGAEEIITVSHETNDAF